MWIQRFSKLGVSPNHPFYRIFPEFYHPAIGVAMVRSAAAGPQRPSARPVKPCRRRRFSTAVFHDAMAPVTSWGQKESPGGFEWDDLPLNMVDLPRETWDL